MSRMVIPSNFDWPLCPAPSGVNRSVDYICGNCRTVLLHAEDGLMHNILILCTELDFGRFKRRRRARFRHAAKYAAEFLCCLGAAGTCKKFDDAIFRGELPRWHH